MTLPAFEKLSRDEVEMHLEYFQRKLKRVHLEKQMLLLQLDVNDLDILDVQHEMQNTEKELARRKGEAS
jgi:hypothetical protein